MKKVPNILFLAPIRKGGPHLSLQKLSSYLIKEKKITGEFKASLIGFVYGIFAKKFDVIHTVLPLPFNIWRTPIILNIRGDFRREKGIRNPLGYFYPLAIKTATKIISPSNFLGKELNLQNYEVIPNFVNEELFTIKKTPKKHQKEEIHIATMTKFHFRDKAKGVVKLVEILSKLKTKKKIIFSIYGGGRYLNEVKEEVSKIHLNNNITLIWKGFINNPHKSIIENDIFLYWSDHDNFPNAVLEALGLGMLVISNDVGAVREFAKKESGIFIYKKKNDFIKKLNLILKKESFSNNHKKFIQKNYSLSNISKKFYNVYTKFYKVN
jgi:glycosyltransferase involved in cell wall biosynthesis